jgi:hypothetical protein
MTILYLLTLVSLHRVTQKAQNLFLLFSTPPATPIKTLSQKLFRGAAFAEALGRKRKFTLRNRNI